jgi:hypothetical protein
MFPPAIRIVIAFVLVVHGIGHGMGFLPLLGKRLSPSHSADSWALGPLIGEDAARAAGSGIWVLCIAGFLLSALGLVGRVVPEIWPTVAAASSVISLAGLALFWNAFPFLFPNKVGIILVDAGVLAWVIKGGGG